MIDLKQKTLDFRKSVEELPREEILEIIRAQEPSLIKQINRIEWVFKEKLRHLNWSDGVQITERPLTNEELALLVDEPFEFSEELAAIGLNLNQQRQIHIAKDPVTWIKSISEMSEKPLKPRVYQILILRHPKRFKVLRAGRRLGKTHSMAIMLLWYSYTTANGRSLVLAPMLAQAKLIYDEILVLMERAPAIRDSISRTVASPPAEIDFTNGSSIKFFTSGMKSNSKSDATRGQEAHLLVLDELDYMGDEDLEAVLAMMQKTDENQPDKMIMGASTPTGKRGKFYDWCVDPKKTGRFKEFWFPSYCHPMFDKEMEQFLREEHKTEMGFRHEVEADWGELSEGVYPRGMLERAFNELEAWDYIPGLTSTKSSYVIGVDWDKYAAGTNIVVLEIFGKDYERQSLRGKVRLAHREETVRDEYSLLKAVDRLIDLNYNFKPDWIYIDRGYGDTQFELLKKHGMDHPETKLTSKLKGIQFGQSIEVRDPFTMLPVKKEIKPFMVSSLKEMLEEDRIFFPSHDTDLFDQLSHYIVTNTTKTGRQVFEMASSDIPDHAHDALILAVLAVAENYNSLFKIDYATRVKTVSNSVFLNTLPLEGSPKEIEKDQKIIEQEYGAISAAPYQVRRSMTSGSKKSNKPIRRQMF